MWLKYLLGNPLKYPAPNVPKGEVSCQKCTGEMKAYIMSVKRGGLSQLLADTFINNLSGIIIPQMLIKKITMYLDAGKVILTRLYRAKCPPINFVNVTVLQLISSGVIQMEISKEERCFCCLVDDSLCHVYLNGSIWN